MYWVLVVSGWLVPPNFVLVLVLVLVQVQVQVQVQVLAGSVGKLSWLYLLLCPVRLQRFVDWAGQAECVTVGLVGIGWIGPLRSEGAVPSAVGGSVVLGLRLLVAGQQSGLQKRVLCLPELWL